MTEYFTIKNCCDNNKFVLHLKWQNLQSNENLRNFYKDLFNCDGGMNKMNVSLNDTKLVNTLLQNYNLICFDMIESYDKQTADDKVLFGECLAIVEISIEDIDLLQVLMFLIVRLF